MMTKQLTDRARILAYLHSDRVYAAYAIGDLDEGLFEQCAWRVAEEAGRPRALAMVYAGFDPPILFLMGDSDGVAALLQESARIRRACPMAQEKHLPALGQYYCWSTDNLWPMWRMALRLTPNVEFSPAGVTRLTWQDTDRLRALYALGGGDAFASAQINLGVFYGLEQDGQLVATAGTHLVSDTYSVAAVGNVMTHPALRGRGYATRATGAVCAELVRRGIGTIVLNVGQDNPAAVRVYEKLGFARHCAFYEGLVERR